MASKKHILVIDDEADIRDVLAQALGMKGYRVSSAETGHEALRIVRADPPELIISDLQMEDSDGLELIDRIKAASPDLPIILLTGVIFDPEVIRDNISKKVAVYLDKTASLQRVMQEVRRLLGDLDPNTASAVGK